MAKVSALCIIFTIFCIEYTFGFFGEITDWVEDTTNDAVDGAVDVGTVVGQGIIDTGTIVGEGVVEGGTIVGEGTVEGGTIVGEGVVEGGTIVGEGTVEGGEIVGEGITDTGELVIETAEDVVEHFRRLFDTTDLNHILEQVTKIDDIITQVDKIPDLVTKAADIAGITDFVSDIPDIADDIVDGFSSVIDSISDLADIFDITDFSLSLDTDADEDALKENLNQCVDDLTSIVGAADALNAVMDIDIPLPDGFNIGIGDIRDVGLVVVAKVLKPLADPVNAFCDHIVPELVSVADGIKDMFSDLADLFTGSDTDTGTPDDSCDDHNGFCTAQNVSDYVGINRGTGLLYRAFITILGPVMFTDGINAASDANKVAIWRYVMMMMRPSKDAVDKICQSLAEIEFPYFFVDLIVMTACEVINMIFLFAVAYGDALIDFADFHDGMIMVAQNDAILQSASNIIYNQQTSLQSLMLLTQYEEWIPALTLGGDDNTYNGELMDIGEKSFNQILSKTTHPIIKRECKDCNPQHQLVYYRRLTDMASFDAYNNMKDWTNTDNVLGADFNLYSTLEDALANTNPWVYCDYNDAGVGAFRDCAPLSDTDDCQWTADVLNGGNYNTNCPKNTKFSIYVATNDGATISSLKNDAESILTTVENNHDTMSSAMQTLTDTLSTETGGILTTVGSNHDTIVNAIEGLSDTLTANTEGISTAITSNHNTMETTISALSDTLTANTETIDDIYSALFSLGYDWIPALTLGGTNNSYGGQVIDIGDRFNSWFAASSSHIIMRECNECNPHHQVIYYRRLRNVKSFDAYSNMKLWTNTDNELGQDFNLYSTLEDALENTNPWLYCDYNDVGVGAFRDCAPLNDTDDCQWTSDVLNGGIIYCSKSTKFSIYVGSTDIASLSSATDDILASVVINNNDIAALESMMLLLHQTSGGWLHALTLGGSDNSFHDVVIDIGSTSFNGILAEAMYPIIRRECNGCDDHHKLIYYRRLSDTTSFDAYSNMKVWTNTDNVLGQDFNLYSTLEDALVNTNPWIYCDYNDAAVGAFRDCAPSNDTAHCQWTSDVLNGGLASCPKSVRFSLYVGNDDASTDIDLILSELATNAEKIAKLESMISTEIILLESMITTQIATKTENSVIYDGNGDDHTFVIEISTRNLYIIGMALISFVLVFISLGVIAVVKCCYPNSIKSHKYKAVKCFDSESELESGRGVVN